MPRSTLSIPKGIYFCSKYNHSTPLVRYYPVLCVVHVPELELADSGTRRWECPP